MNVTVTRQYKGKKDPKGNIVSSYNYQRGSTISNVDNATNVIKNTTIINNIPASDALITYHVPFAIFLNFIDLIPFAYKCPDNLTIYEQLSEFDVDAVLFVGVDEYVLGDFLSQWDEITISPATLGCILLTGTMQYSGNAVNREPNFIQYIEVKQAPYIYIAYASDDTGTDFTTTNDEDLAFMAILKSPTKIDTPIASDFAGLWRGGSAGLAIGDWTEDITFDYQDVVAGTAKDYLLDPKATFPYTIISAILETDTGTLTGVAIKIGSTALTSVSSVTVDTTNTTNTATGANTVVADDRVWLCVTTGSSGAPTLIRGKLRIQRT